MDSVFIEKRNVKIVEFIENTQKYKEFLVSKGVQLLKRELKKIEEIEQVVIKNIEVCDNYKEMTEELVKHGYDQFRFLGAGVQGCVVIAKERQSNIRYAIKGVKLKDLQGKLYEEVKKASDREIEMLRDCNDLPYTPNLFNVIEGNRMRYIAINECKGTLNDLITQVGGKLSEISMIKYSKDIAEGIYLIHKKKYLIQDLKPDNILIDYQDDAIVADFGLCNKMKEDSYTGKYGFMGNYFYQAPETLEMYHEKYAEKGISISKKPNKHCDAFSFGQLMYGLIFGEPSLFQFVAKKDEPLQFSKLFESFQYKKPIKKLILGLAHFNPKERLEIEDALFTLKGLVSQIFEVENINNNELTDHNADVPQFSDTLTQYTQSVNNSLYNFH